MSRAPDRECSPPLRHSLTAAARVATLSTRFESPLCCARPLTTEWHAAVLQPEGLQHRTHRWLLRKTPYCPYCSLYSRHTILLLVCGSLSPHCATVRPVARLARCMRRCERAQPRQVPAGPALQPLLRVAAQLSCSVFARGRVPYRARCDVQIGHRTLELAFHLELGRAERVPPRPLGLELGLQMRTRPAGLGRGCHAPWLPITLCAVCLALSVTPSALLPVSVRLCALSVPQSPFGPYPDREGFSHTCAACMSSVVQLRRDRSCASSSARCAFAARSAATAGCSSASCAESQSAHAVSQHGPCAPRGSDSMRATRQRTRAPRSGCGYI
jgi:hypothetical protein